MTTEHTAPRIYAACLASYNSGRLYGQWIDCEGLDGEALRIAIDDMLAGFPCPNVMRRKCSDCGHYQTDARPHRENNDECSNCSEPLSAEFKPSAEEWAIPALLAERIALADAAAIAEILADDDDDKRRGFLWLVNDRGYSVTDAIDKAGDVRTYQADAHDLAGYYAQELFEDIGPRDESGDMIGQGQWPFNCIDWERAGRELVTGGDVDITEIDGERFMVTNASEF